MLAEKICVQYYWTAIFAEVTYSTEVYTQQTRVIDPMLI